MAKKPNVEQIQKAAEVAIERGLVAADFRPIDQLIPYAKNAKKHPPEQVARLAGLITEFGWTNPVLADAKGIVAGHGRVMAARKLYEAGATIKLPSGVEIPHGTVPVLDCTGWDENKRRFYIIADNQSAESEWDEDILKLELSDFATMDFDLDLLGFDPDELKRLRGTVVHFGNTDADEELDPPAEPITRVGDIWLLGECRVMCGNSLDREHVDKLCAGVTPDLANCDPPYGISIVKGAGNVGGAKAFGAANVSGHVHGRGKTGFGKVHGTARNAIIEPNTYAPIIGDDTTATAIGAHAMLTAIGAHAIVLWGGNYFANAMPPSRCWLVWDKENSGTFADVELAWTNQDAVARLLRHQWNGLIKASERGEKRVHPTQKPVALADWVIDTVAPDAKTVIDLFLGSGSTLISATRRGLCFFGMELAPAYVDVAVERWQRFAGKTAVLEGDGRSFAEVMAERTPDRRPAEVKAETPATAKKAARPRKPGNARGA